MQNRSKTPTTSRTRTKVRTAASPFDPLATKVTASPLSCERFIDEEGERILVSSELTNLINDVSDPFIDDSAADEIFGPNRNPTVAVIDNPETVEIERSEFDSIFNETPFEHSSSNSGIIDKITAGITKFAAGNFSETNSENSAHIFDRKLLAKIACYAAREIEGVIPNKPGVVNGLVNVLRRSINGIKVEVGRTEAAIDMAITVKYGADIPDVVSRL
ncbi:MAG: Asp23/Gls24 family envelope stress response protein, partial [bacterium]